MLPTASRPTPAFVASSWVALMTGAVGFCVGLSNATITLASKGFYLTLLLFGLFAVVSLQKAIRDRAEGLRVTDLYLAISWVAVVSSLALLVVGLYNATMLLSEKGFYGMSFLLAVFGAVTVQKNVRDLALAAPDRDADREAMALDEAAFAA